MAKALVKRRRVKDAVVVSQAAIVAAIQPRVDVRIREGTIRDLPFIDAMQKSHSRELGFLPTQALEGKIERGEVLVAAQCVPPQPAHPSPLPETEGIRVGYLIAADRYQKRDEIGCITQINVRPEYRRSLVAAALLQAQFDRSAYGCRLYCCWCAQDLVEANEFWEAMGFAAIAFRTGSRRGRHKGTKARRHEGSGEGSKAGSADSLGPCSGVPHSVPSFPARRDSVAGPRIHIFWQKRIRAGDDVTPWWYPSTTGGGEMREDRLVFPIPPGVSWRDVLPVVLAGGESSVVSGQLSVAEQRKPRVRVKKVKKVRGPRIKGGLWFYREELVEAAPAAAPAVVEKGPKASVDPRLKKLARELRDRWSERAELMVAPVAKHDVRRMLSEAAVSPAASPAPARRVGRGSLRRPTLPLPAAA